MTDETTPDPSPAAGGDASPPVAATPPAADTTTPAPTASPPPVEATPAPTEFKLPDAHKDKPWASKIKSQDDVYKTLDNLQTAIGKKSLYPAADATPEEWDQYLAGMRPEDASVYEFGEGANKEFVEAISPVLLEAGISKHQAGKLIPAYQKFEAAMAEQYTSADGFKAEMVKSFGDKYDATVASIVNEHKQHLSQDDQALMDKIPNQYLGVVYRLTSAMQKAYGANEGGADAHTQKGGAPIGEDINKVRSELRSQITALETRPHTAQEKQDLVDKLQKTYENQGKK